MVDDRCIPSSEQTNEIEAWGTEPKTEYTHEIQVTYIHTYMKSRLRSNDLTVSSAPCQSPS